MNYTDVKNPQWANAEHTAINCDVDFDDLREELVPFTAVASGDYEHSHQIFAKCVAGNYGEIAEYVAPPVPEYTPPPEPTKAELLAQLQELTAKIEALGEV
jgi:hypothetical protein